MKDKIKTTMMCVPKETVLKLKDLGKKGETYNDLILKLIDFYLKHKDKFQDK